MSQSNGIDFFISRRGRESDIIIARKIDGILREAGYRTLFEEDFGAQSFMSRMEEGFSSVDNKVARVIALVSESYLKSDHCRVEYQYPLIEDPLNRKRRLIVFRIEDVPLSGFLKPLKYTDLFPCLEDDKELKSSVLKAIRHDSAAAHNYVAGSRLEDKLIHARICKTPNFTARDMELESIGKHFQKESTRLQSAPIVLTGLGGMGKSVLAQEYAARRQAEYAGVWWIQADNLENIDESFLELGARLVQGIENIRDTRDAAYLTLQHLADQFATTGKPWLLIYDNIDHEQLYRQRAPRGGVHALLTSRTKNWSNAAYAIEVSSFPEEKASKYLINESGRNDIPAPAAARLCATLGYLPLAISHASAFLKQNRLISAGKYESNLKRWLNKVPSQASYPKAVFATFQEAVLACEGQSSGAMAVLCFASVLGADGIPLKLFRQPRNLYPDELKEVVADQDAFVDALGVLDRFSLVDLNIDKQHFSIHRLVSAALQDHIQQDITKWAAAAVAVIRKTTPEQKYRSWPNWVEIEPLLSHARAAVRFSNLDSNEVAEGLLKWIGHYYYEREDFSEAEYYFKRALNAAEAEGAPSLVIMGHLNNLAESIRAQKKISVAEVSFQQALNIHPETNNNIEYKRTLSALLNNYALLKIENGENDEAESLLNRALELDRSIRPDGHPDIARTRFHLAELFHKTGRELSAENEYQAALQIDLSAFPSDHPKIALRRCGLGKLYLSQKKYDRAKEEFQAARNIYEVKLPRNHNSLVEIHNAIRQCKE